MRPHPHDVDHARIFFFHNNSGFDMLVPFEGAAGVDEGEELVRRQHRVEQQLDVLANTIITRGGEQQASRAFPRKDEQPASGSVGSSGCVWM